MKIKNPIYTIFALLLCVHKAWSHCELDVLQNFGDYAPLLLNFRDQSFIYPTQINPKEIVISKTSKILAFCPGSSIQFSGNDIKREGYLISCAQGSKFWGPSGQYEFKDIRCTDVPEISTRETGDCPNGRLIEIGFRTMPTSFTRTIEVCYDKNTAWTYWAHSMIPASINSNQPGLKIFKDKFSTSGLSDDIPVVEAYFRSEQRKMLHLIMSRDEALVDKYIPTTGSNFFARSHLVGRNDQFFKSQQNSTYYYINVMPMWHSINNGNWRLVEDLVHGKVNDLGDLEVYSGALYNLRLFHTSTSTREIYLAKNTVTDAPALFVPKIFFKLIFNRAQTKAIVMLTLNNPYLTSETLSNDFKVCPEYEQCHKLNQNLKRFDLGYTYCCTYKDFMRDSVAKSIGLPILPDNVKPLL